MSLSLTNYIADLTVPITAVPEPQLLRFPTEWTAFSVTNTGSAPAFIRSNPNGLAVTVNAGATQTGLMMNGQVLIDAARPTTLTFTPYKLNQVTSAQTISAIAEMTAFGERRAAVTLNVPGDYATLTLALAGAEVAAATVNARVCIQLQEGTYDVAFDLDTHYFVDIRGMGQGLTTLAYTGDGVDTASFGGGDCVVYDCTFTHNGSSKRAGHKDNNLDATKLPYSRGGAVRCTFTGLGKSAFGGRVYANQEFWLIDCTFTTDTTEAVYLNNAASQSYPCAWYLINCNCSSTASEGLTIYSCGSGQKDTVTIIGGVFKGAAGVDILMDNAGAGAGEFQVWIDSSAVYNTLTNTAGTLHRGIGPLYQAALSSVPSVNGVAFSSRYNLYPVTASSGPYIYNNGGALSFVNTSGTVVLQASGVFNVQTGYLQTNAGVQAAFLGPITYGSQTVSTTPVTLSASSGGMHILCSNDGGTVNLPAAPNANQEFTFVYDPGGAAGSPLTIDGNGKTINGSASISVTTRYSSRTVKYIGGQWYLSGSVGS